MKAILRILASIWGAIRAVQSFTGTVLFILLVVLAAGILLSDEAPSVPDGAALMIRPEGLLVEQRSDVDPFVLLTDGADGTREVLHRDILAALDEGAQDDRIAYAVVNFDNLAEVGVVQAHEIAAAIGRFRESGKKVYAHGRGFSQTGYLMASHADHVSIDPMGTILLTGYGLYPTYFAEALESLGIRMEIFRVGTYKSAVEPFTRNSMSDDAAEANRAVLSSLWSEYLSDMGGARGLEPASIQSGLETAGQAVQDAGGDLPRLALEAGYVDAIMTGNELEAHIRQDQGISGDSVPAIDYEAYLESRNDLGTNGNGAIAVIVAEGLIVTGEQPPGVVGGKTVARHIRNAHESPSTEAIVLRVDSGGGSALGSDTIRRELDAAKDKGIPVLVSMGNVAASGGYWISAVADEIWAHPATITGSIGIFALFPVIDESLAKLGIEVDGVGTTPLSAAFNPGLPMNDMTRTILQATTEDGYERFLELVSTHRDMSREDVDRIGQGRIWSGVQALDLGLVDRLGTFEEVLAAAAERAELETYTVRFFEEEPDFLDRLIMSMAGNQAGSGGPAGPLKLWSRTLLRDAGELLRLNDPNGLYALCEGCRVR